MTKEEKQRDRMDFTTGNILQKLIGFMLPILASQILITMYGSVDILVVGWFGTDESISAVSTGSSIIQTVTFVLNGLTMGITVLMGRYIGEKKQDKLSQVIGGAVATFVLISVVMSVVLLILAPQISELMQAPEAAMDKTIVYVRICGGMIIFIIGYNLISNIFRGIGNSRLPLLFVAIACVINIFGDLLFVAVFHWDVAGAALATVLAQAVSLVMSVMVCRKIELPFSLKLSDVRFNGEVKKFLLLGLPIGFQELLTQISFMCLIAFVNGMGSTPDMQLASSSGYGIANKLVNIVMLVPGSLMQSLSSFIAQNVGAGKEKRATKTLLYGIGVGGSIGVVMALLAFFNGQGLASLFSSNVLYQAKAAEYLSGFAIEAVVTAILFSFIGYFNGHDQTLFVMLQGIAQSFIVRLPMAYAMSRLYPDSMVYVGLAAPTATVFGIAINVCFFFIYRRKIADRLKNAVE